MIELRLVNEFEKKRILIGLSQDELAERIDRAPKYISDIERGICGMSIETMISFSQKLDLSLDYLIFGNLTESNRDVQTNEEMAIIVVVKLFCNTTT